MPPLAIFHLVGTIHTKNAKAQNCFNEINRREMMWGEMSVSQDLTLATKSMYNTIVGEQIFE